MENVKKQFDEWMNAEMQQVKVDAAAYCVLIYEEADEESDDKYSVDLVAFDEYDEYDCDWACGDGIYASHCNDRLLYFEIEGGWEECLEQVETLLEDYLQQGQYSTALKNAEAVGYGFADGDIEIAYSK
ncbi:MAG: hypothetical protein K2O08_03045 [Clostridia bacterium]|nr:hypothetical protein [Clostridia bacterium]